MVKLRNVLPLFLITGLTLTSAQTGNISNFSGFIEEVNLLEKQQKYQEAMALTEKVWQLFPEHRFDLIKEMEYLNEKTAQYEKNLEIWDHGHRQGFFFMLNKRMKKYEPYLQFEEFNELVQKDMELRETALDNSQTIYEISHPVDFISGRRYPLLMILHGGGSNIEKAKERWKIVPPLSTDYLVVFIQSYRHYDSKTFGWRSSDQRSHKDIKRIFSEIKTEYLIDTSKVIIGGTSAGGSMALDLAFHNIIPVYGIVAFCPGKPADLNRDKIKNKQIKIYMLGGEYDYYLPRQQEIAGIFNLAGIDYRHKVIPGMSHEFPRNYEMIINEALHFLIQGQERM